MSGKMKKIGSIDGKELYEVKNNIPNTVFKSRFIALKQTFVDLRDKKEAKKTMKMDYGRLEDFLNMNKNNLFADNKRYQINLLTDVGWRAGKAFNGGNFDLYDPTVFYDEVALESVFAIQILEF